MGKVRFTLSTGWQERGLGGMEKGTYDRILVYELKDTQTGWSPERVLVGYGWNGMQDKSENMVW